MDGRPNKKKFMVKRQAQALPGKMVLRIRGEKK